MINVLVPDMPTADELLPYLRRIDQARWYSNGGPLVQEFEARLQKLVGVPCVAVSTGTAAIELVLCAVRFSTVERIASVPVWMSDAMTFIPSLTFSATGLAAMSAGCPICVVDVNDNGQLPIPTLVSARHVSVPVASFGKPVEIVPWETHADETHMPVVIDAAGAFGEQSISRHHLVTTCFSFHATKIVGAGEGGCVFSADAALLDRIRDMRNFGEGGTNAKMSEYHAAVCHASLDRLPSKVARMNKVNRLYERYLPKGVQASISSTMLNIMVTDRAEQLKEALATRMVETKQWYRPYLHERSDFSGFCSGPMTMSEHFAKSTLGLPYHTFLTRTEVRHICQSVEEIL